MKSFLRILGVASLLALASLPPLMGLDPDNGMTVDPVTKVATFSWKSEPGFTYFVQTSTDLKTWQYLNYIQSGDGGSLSVHFDANAAPRLFCRLRYTDYPYQQERTLATWTLTGTVSPTNRNWTPEPIRSTPTAFRSMSFLPTRSPCRAVAIMVTPPDNR